MPNSGWWHWPALIIAIAVLAVWALVGVAPSGVGTPASRLAQREHEKALSSDEVKQAKAKCHSMGMVPTFSKDGDDTMKVFCMYQAAPAVTD